MYILKILFVLLLLLFPFGEILRFDVGNDIRFKPIDILTGIIFIYWLVLLIMKRSKAPKFSWVYVLFPLICLLSLVINSFWLQQMQLLASAFYLIRWIIYFGIFFIVAQFDVVFKKNLLLLLIIDGFAIVFLGFVQYFFFSSLKPLYYMGWDDHMYRLFSVFLDPNYTGAFFVLYLLFICGLIYKYLKNTKQKAVHIQLLKTYVVSKKHVLLLLSIIASLTLMATFLTFSRSSLLMLVAGLSVFFILIGKKKLIFALLGIIVVFIIIISSHFSVENINLFRHASSNARIGNYESAAKIIVDKPLIGIGFNTYRYAKERYHIQAGWVKAPSHADAGVDNSFLFVLVTTGIVGLTAYMLLWGTILKRAFLHYRKTSNIYAIIFIASTVGLFIHALFINSLFFPAMMLWMWVIAGLTEQKSR